MFVRLIWQLIYDLFVNIVILEFILFLENYSVLFFDDVNMILVEEVLEVEFMLRLFLCFECIRIFQKYGNL